MNKIFVVAFFFVPSLVFAQNTVGINTLDPKGVLHIDAVGDNIDSNPDSSQILNDVIIKTDNNEVSMGVGGEPVTSAQLHLADPNKAFLFNRVQLQSAIDTLTVPRPQEGMMVYNLSKQGAFPDDVSTGVYFFSGRRWFPFLSGLFNRAALTSRDLQTELSSTPATDINDYSGAAVADFGEMKMTENGYFTFSLRLYGGLTNAEAWRRTLFYVYLFNGDTLVDAIEVSVPAFGSGPKYELTYTALLRGLFMKNDVAKIKLTHNRALDIIWTWQVNMGLNPNKTSVLYWKG